MSQVRWAPITGYEDAYEVSSSGAVRSLTRLVRVVRCGTHYEVVKAGKLVRIAKDRRRQPRVYLCRSNVRRWVKVSDLLADAFPPDDPTHDCKKISETLVNPITGLRLLSCHEFPQLRRIP